MTHCKIKSIVIILCYDLIAKPKHTRKIITNNNTELHKNKHLSFGEYMTIQIHLKDGYSAYKIVKELNRSINTILNEMRRGATTQIKQEIILKCTLPILAKLFIKSIVYTLVVHPNGLECIGFINYAVYKIKHDSWSPDACVGYALEKDKFQRS